jgi:hypothetical protein
MAVGPSAAVANAILNAYFNQTNITAPTGIWIQLHVGDPGASGTANVAQETTRKDITSVFSAASAGAVTSDTLVSWTNVGFTEDYTHWAMFSASSAGTFYWSGTITANSVTAGDTFNLAVGDIDIALSPIAA